MPKEVVEPVTTAVVAGAAAGGIPSELN